MSVVVETNVLATANSYATHVNPECVENCIDALTEVYQGGAIILDDGMRILNEYMRYSSPKGKPGPGDVFMKWVWDNRTNPEICIRITITPKPTDPENFLEFPADAALATFDRADRKWVAVALASKINPEVLNATDTDWWDHRVALAKNGVRVRFLCPDLMTR